MRKAQEHLCKLEQEKEQFFIEYAPVIAAPAVAPPKLALLKVCGIQEQFNDAPKSTASSNENAQKPRPQGPAL